MLSWYRRVPINRTDSLMTKYKKRCTRNRMLLLFVVCNCFCVSSVTKTWLSYLMACHCQTMTPSAGHIQYRFIYWHLAELSSCDINGTSTELRPTVGSLGKKFTLYNRINWYQRGRNFTLCRNSEVVRKCIKHDDMASFLQTIFVRVCLLLTLINFDQIFYLIRQNSSLIVPRHHNRWTIHGVTMLL